MENQHAVELFNRLSLYAKRTYYRQGLVSFLRIVEDLLNSAKTIEGLEKLAKDRYPNLQANIADGNIYLSSLR